MGQSARTYSLHAKLSYHSRVSGICTRSTQNNSAKTTRVFRLSSAGLYLQPNLDIRESNRKTESTVFLLLFVTNIVDIFFSKLLTWP